MDSTSCLKFLDHVERGARHTIAQNELVVIDTLHHHGVPAIVQGTMTKPSRCMIPLCAGIYTPVNLKRTAHETHRFGARQVNRFGRSFSP